MHIVDISGFEGRDPVIDFEKINLELSKFSKKLSNKKQIVFANKIDNIYEGIEELKEKFEKEIISHGIEKENIVFGSILTGENLKELVSKIWRLVKDIPRDVIEEEANLDEVLPDLVKKQDDWIVKKLDDEVYEVKGQIVDNVLRKYVLIGEEGIIQFLQIMRKLGMEKVLEDNGVVEGDTIIIAGYEFTYVI